MKCFWFLIPFLFSIGPAAWAEKEAVQIYVSSDGKDNWTGSRPEPDGDASDGPLATIEEALNRVLKAREASPSADIEVILRGGVYRLSKPVEITSRHSSRLNAKLTLTSHSGEEAVFSGGIRISQGKEESLSSGMAVWVYEVPVAKKGNLRFRQLFVNDERRPRTRLPKEGVFHFEKPVDVSGENKWNHGSYAAIFQGDDLRNWSNLDDVEIVALTRWIETRMPIQSVDEQKRIVEFTKRSTFRLEDTRYKDRFARYYVENVFDELDEEREWYLDRAAGRLHYIPAKGESVESSHLVAPILDQLVQITGESENGKETPARNVIFKDLIFRHTEWEYPEDDAGSNQAAWEVPGAIYFATATNCLIEGCRIESVGTYAVEVGEGCRDISIRNSVMRDLGAGGVKIGHGSSHTTVADCEIAEGGRIYHSAVGVWIGHSGDNAVLHNHIHDLFYTGISVGWSWGYAPSKAVRNRIEHNHIQDIGQGLLSDMGGIYTLGVSEGTRLAGNHIHDVSSYSYGGWGLYTDEGSTHITIENNLAYRTKTGGFHQHYGKENVVRNNILAYAVDHQIQRSREEDHKSFDFVGNIVLFDQGELLGNTWSNDQFFMDRNLYWNPEPSQIDFKGASLEEWRDRGHDIHSRIADPLFLDPKKGDFRLRSDSPAIEMGFEPFDWKKAGPRTRGPQVSSKRAKALDPGFCRLRFPRRVPPIFAPCRFR